MIKVKHLDGEMKPIEREFNTVRESIEYDFSIYWSLGENCSFFYKNIELGTDNNKTIDENVEILESQIRFIERALKDFKNS